MARNAPTADPRPQTPDVAAATMALNGPMLRWLPALEHPDLLPAPVVDALREWPRREAVEVVEIDPDLADTAALIAATDITPQSSANCLVILGKRGGEERVAAAVVLASTKADVNSAVRRALEVRKCSFMSMDRAVTETGMEYGGITPIGLPAQWPVLVDSRVLDAPSVVIGSGLRRSKLRMPGALVADLPGVQVVPDLAVDLQ